MWNGACWSGGFRDAVMIDYLACGRKFSIEE